MKFQISLLFCSLLLLIQCKHPILYEISTRPWLFELSKKYQRSITKLRDIPLEEFDYLKENGIDMVWMMGVWKLGNYGIEFDRRQDYYSSVLPGWTKDDVIGSPYAVVEYTCNPELGTDEDLAWLRSVLNSKGLKLMLDFVPNHSAIDAPTAANKKLYIRAPEGKKDPNKYTDDGIAFGRYNRQAWPWKDVIQWNYWEPETREIMKGNLLKVLSLSDGVRCDVASLVLNDDFENTWKEELDYWKYPKPKMEFWEWAFKEVKQKYPNAILLAEVYGEREIEALFKNGFTYTYDKELLNKLMGTSKEVKDYIHFKKTEYLSHSAHYIENHDENRIIYNLKGNVEKAKAAGTIAATLGGMIFMHHGQWSGLRNKVEVHLRRGADEKENAGVKKYYKRLMQILQDPAFTGSGYYYVYNVSGDKKDEFIAYIREEGDSHYLVVVNYSDKEGCSNVPIHNFEGTGERSIHEVIDDVEYIRNAEHVRSGGLIVCLYPWQSQIFKYNY